MLRREPERLRRTVQNTSLDRSKPRPFAADPQYPVHDTTTYTTNTNKRTNTPPHTLPRTHAYTHAHTFFRGRSGAPRLPVPICSDGERPLFDSRVALSCCIPSPTGARQVRVGPL